MKGYKDEMVQKARAWRASMDKLMYLIKQYKAHQAESYTFYDSATRGIEAEILFHMGEAVAEVVLAERAAFDLYEQRRGEDGV